ncbi:MAG TPA: class I SAM-dependent methyltransferase, partial [bacterium]|nr:class I SAM-dependent methyltransferase [bacterium]
MESVACALCGADRTTELFRTKDRNWRLPGEFTVVRCAECGLVYVNPRPTPEEMAEFYPETFSVRPHFFKGTDGLAIQGTPWEMVMERKLAPLLKLKKSGRILDVGCGDCLLLLYLQKKGWEVFGLEPRRDAVDLARKTFGLDVRPGLLEESDFEKGSFDALTLMHVFEHVHNPGEIARRISELLAPDGIALIDVP